MQDRAVLDASVHEQCNVDTKKVRRGLSRR